jgi:hypothetical protein
MNAVVEGMQAAQDDDGYLMAFPQNESNCKENPNYVTSWVTHGLMEAHGAGHPSALAMLRRHLDWFNNATTLPLFLPPLGGPGNGDSPFISNKQDPQFDHGHLIYIIYQGIIHHTRVARSEVGQQQDVDTARLLYQVWKGCLVSPLLTPDSSQPTPGVFPALALPGGLVAPRADCAQHQRHLGTGLLSSQLRDYRH